MTRTANRQEVEALDEAGVDVTRTLYTGVPYDSFGMGPVVDMADEAVAEVAERLKAAFEA